MAIILWLILASTMIISYFDVLRELPNDDGRKVAALIIFIIFGPIMATNSVACAMLDLILPDGWSDDDDRII